ncbi:MAG: site-specific integrase [Desulfobulbaceae bacterium]|nr:MAG: site-specific integrase [Desulfobulbaceae bacterium]
MISICSISKSTSKENTVKTCELVLNRFTSRFGKQDLASISQEEILEFLLALTKNNKQATKRNSYSVLASIYNFIINTGLPALTNPCNTSVIRKIFKRPQVIQWNIVDKETVDEIIFRTMNTRNRLMLELMASDGMRVGEVLSLMPADIQERSLTIQNPKSGRVVETVYVPRKILVRLTSYTKAKDIDSKVILRHADLSTTQRYLGKVNDTETTRWIETSLTLELARKQYIQCGYINRTMRVGSVPFCKH